MIVLLLAGFYFSLQNQNPLYQSPEMKYENIAYGRE